MKTISIIVLVATLAVLFSSSPVAGARILAGKYTYYQGRVPTHGPETSEGPWPNNGTSALSDGIYGGSGQVYWYKSDGLKPITFDLDGKYYIDRVVVKHRGQGGDWAVTTDRFNYSIDGGNTWVKVGDEGTAIFGFDSLVSRTRAFPGKNAEITHVKIGFNGRPSHSVPIDEVEIYGTPVPEPAGVLAVSGIGGVLGILRRRRPGERRLRGRHVK